MVASGAGGQGHASELSPLVARHLPVATDSSPTSVPVADARLADGDASSNASKAVAATIIEGCAPYGVAYDSGKGEVFVANGGSNYVSLISDSSNTIVTTIKVGYDSGGVAYDSGKGEVFVAN